MSDETDTTSEVARVRYVEAQPDSGPHRPAMPAHYRIEFDDGTFWAIASSFLIRQGVPVPRHPQIAAPVPAGEAHATSGGSGASGGLGERLREVAESVEMVPYGGLWADADEADELEAAYRVADAEIARLSEFHDHYRDQVERVRALAAELDADLTGIESTQRAAQRIRDAIDGPKPETNENEEGA